MRIRSFSEKDWQKLLLIYNRFLNHDQVDELFFVQHLLLNVNFDPKGVFILEEDGDIVGWTAAMKFRKNLDCWSNIAEKNQNVGFIMLPAVRDTDCALQLIAAAEKYLAAEGCSRIRGGLLGYTLFPNGVDETLYPDLHEAFLRSNYTLSGYSHSMERSLADYSIPQDYRRKIDELAKENIIIKTADIHDLLPLRRMFENSSSTSWMHLICRKAEQHKLHEVLVVRKEHEAIGFCQYNYFGMVDRVGPFKVAEHMNGKGIGTLMIARLLEEMVKNNIQRAWFASCVKDLIHFYQKNGLQVFRKKALFYKDL